MDNSSRVVSFLKFTASIAVGGDHQINTSVVNNKQFKTQFLVTL
jgi:hypothetical protein